MYISIRFGSDETTVKRSAVFLPYITFQELFNNVTKNQAYESSLQGKLQEPTMIIGGQLGDNWGNRTFINN